MAQSPAGNVDTSEATTSPILDLAAGAFFAIICAAGWFSLLSGKRLMASLESGLDPGAAFLPVLVLGLLSLGTTLILIKGLVRFFSGAHGGPSLRQGDHLPAVALFLGMVVLCVAATRIGLLPAAFLFSAAWTAWLSWRRNGRIAPALFSGLILGGLLCTFLYVVFVSVLKVPIG